MDQTQAGTQNKRALIFSVLAAGLSVPLALAVSFFHNSLNERMGNLEAKSDSQLSICMLSNNTLQDKLQEEMQQLRSELLTIQIIMGLEKK